ncbi:MAG: AmmeMemoRadiSam system protein B, partial [Candidatus Omnitrophota bacterium]
YMMKTILLTLAPVFLIASFSFAQEVKSADLAGSWYPGKKKGLTIELENFFKMAKPAEVKGDILAIISPHAGTQFSGPVAAYGFKAVQGRGYKTVIVVGFSHRKYFDGISVYNKGAFRTPLGDAVIDEKLAGEIIAQSERIQFKPDLFNDENSVELLIPFVQYALPDARIVPIAIGSQNYMDAEALAGALANVMRGRKDLLAAVSTDMSHYHPYDEANAIDANTIMVLKSMKAKDLFLKGREQMLELCGLLPVSATLLLAEKLGYDKIEVLKYANSGDTFGDKSRVVGYLSAVVYKNGDSESATKKPLTVNRKPKTEKKDVKNMPERLLNDSQRKRLLTIARESITNFVRDGKRTSFAEKDPVLNQEYGAFVTLHKNGQLRGCIGNMVGRGPLCQTVADMAIQAATGDPRFPDLSAGELGQVDLEISVLSPLKHVKSADEIQIPGHGVIVRKGIRSGVYLPQVATETGWTKEQFLTSLCGSKAGIDPNAWKDPDTDMQVFSAEVFGEKE